MTKEQRIKAKIDAASLAAKHIRQAMEQLHLEAGMPWDSVIAGAHAEVISAMTLAFGGPQSAACCRAAADRVGNLPSSKVHALAFATPAGSA